MTEQNHDFVSLGLNIGQHRLTISAQNVNGVMKHLNDLTEIDDTDPTNPEGISLISDLLDQVDTINAAITLKSGLSATSAPVSAASNTPPAAQPVAPNCDTHNLPMKFVHDGVVKRGANAGKRYEAWQCAAPYVKDAPKCEMKNFAWK